MKQEQLDEIRSLYETLMNQWVLLPEAGTINLNFAE
jgi:hypothetical protein